ncbi:MAG: PDZ domain-containing protein [Epulopiscium sp.]|nr:PDZ domain-containing protein [Candidatus Epulonipiscium sp.]
MTIVVAILVFGLIVLVHEFGHYIIAKKNHITVEEFAIGMGPKLVGKQVGETLYSVRILPIGGFCKMLGEEEYSNDLRSFSSKSVGARMAVIVAGPLMNFLLAFIIILVISSVVGFSSTIIDFIEPGYPAETAQLQEGDKILAVNGKKTQIFEKISFYLSQYKEKEGAVELTVLRNGEKEKVNVQPQWDEKLKIWRVGFAAKPIKGNLFQTIHYSFHRMLFLIHVTVSGFVQLITNQVDRSMVAGPVGIVQVIGETYEVGLKQSFLAAIANVLWLAAALSANLGALNLFPIPALDGSRLIFLAVEGIRGKPVDSDKENMIHFVGLVVLMVFMLYVTYGDIVNLIK